MFLYSFRLGDDFLAYAIDFICEMLFDPVTCIIVWIEACYDICDYFRYGVKLVIRPFPISVEAPNVASIPAFVTHFLLTDEVCVLFSNCRAQVVV